MAVHWGILHCSIKKYPIEPNKSSVSYKRILDHSNTLHIVNVHNLAKSICKIYFNVVKPGLKLVNNKVWVEYPNNFEIKICLSRYELLYRYNTPTDCFSAKILYWISKHQLCVQLQWNQSPKSMKASRSRPFLLLDETTHKVSVLWWI